MIVGTVANGVGVGDGANAATVGIAAGSSGVETVSGVLEGEDSALEQAVESTTITARACHKWLLRLFSARVLRAYLITPL